MNKITIWNCPRRDAWPITHSHELSGYESYGKMKFSIPCITYLFPQYVSDRSLYNNNRISYSFLFEAWEGFSTSRLNRNILDHASRYSFRRFRGGAYQHEFLLEKTISTISFPTISFPLHLYKDKRNVKCLSFIVSWQA